MPLRAPLVVVVIAKLQDHVKVPKAEQRLAAGCAAHGILIAAHAQGLARCGVPVIMAYSPMCTRGWAGRERRGDRLPVPRHAA
jgi:hypothetical protein